MNLLQDPWMPVRCRDGSRQWISPAELGRPEFAAFDADRADFNGALAQFGIALLQTVAAVDSPLAWQQRFKAPPDEATLRGWLTPYLTCFELDGDAARFMQDFELREGDGEAVPIGQLLIEAPGENALKNNGDHFIKRHQVNQLCPACAALALFTLQTNAPAGGVGYRTGLRGGGPLSTLLAAVPGSANDSLWHTLWLNVLTAPSFESLNGDAALSNLHYKLPWMARNQAIQPEGSAAATAPSQVHPLHVMWSMPRRIRLNTAQPATGSCDLCQRTSTGLLSGYVARNYGLNYKGAWRHPLTPYYTLKDEQLPIHPQPGGIGYRHWLGWVLGMHSDKRQIEPAGVVSRFLNDGLARRTGSALHLWSFGYDMDNMKARCWYEATLPLYDLAECDANAQQTLRDELTAWLAGADLAASYLRHAVKDAWFSADARGDFSHIDAAFWSRTEPRFYPLLRDTLASLRKGAGLEALDALKLAWLAQLQAAALALFDQDLVGAGPIQQQNMARVARAHNQLRANLHGPKLRTALALPVPVSAAAKSKGKGKGTGKSVGKGSAALRQPPTSPSAAPSGQIALSLLAPGEQA